MSGRLPGRRIAILATDGVEQVEITEPQTAARDEGAQVDLVAPANGRIQGLRHIDQGDLLEVDVSLENADASSCDGLILAGGVVNATTSGRIRMRSPSPATSSRPGSPSP
jgi:protease I